MIFVLTILLPLIAIVMLWVRSRQPLSGWIATLILATGVVGFSVLVAPWGRFGVPVRYALIVLFVIALVWSLRRAPSPETRPESPLRMLVKVVVGLFFGSVAVGVLRGHAVPPGAVDLKFPLRGGTYVVGHGGSTSASNMYHADPTQTYAVDLMKLNGAGMHARAIDGAPVVSPCDGVVREAGGHVVLRCGSADVWLGCLQHGSVAVRPGTPVRTGQLLGRVGNSGTAAGPYLHVYAERNGTAVPVTFDGEWLVRNDLVRR
jgi:hypothetical protein